MLRKGDNFMILHSQRVAQVIDGSDTGVFQKELIVTKRGRLAMVRKRLDANDGGTLAPVLLVHGFAQNRYAWHLPSRSPANQLARAGFDVYNLDLRGHGRSRHFGSKPCLSLEDYVREDLPSAIEEVQAHSGSRKVYIVGHSLGGIVACSAAAQLAGAVAGVTSIGAPYHFTRGSYTLALLHVLIRALRLEHIGPVDPGLPVGAAGQVLRAIRVFAESPLYPIPLRGWHAGSCEPHVLSQHLNLAFDRAGLAELGQMFAYAKAQKLGASDVDYVEQFEKQDLPLLFIAGANDDIAPPASVRPAFTRSHSTDRTYREFPLGHIDLLVGRDAPTTTWPLVTNWLRERAA